MPSVKDIMTKDVVSIGVDDTVFDAAEHMSSNQLGCLVVMDDEVPVGIITERDIVRRVCAKKLPGETKVSEIMSKSLITIDPDASLKEAARVMSSNKIRRLPVLKQNKLVGIIVASDFVRNLGKKSVSEEILEAMGRYPSSASPL
ncbi:MAG: CBS domain-containing protein [Candidatus Bathyarchaeia archaeon]|jgi:CBS domain-containing protein